MNIIFLEFNNYSTVQGEKHSFDKYIQCFNFELYKDRPCYPTIIQKTNDSFMNFYRYLIDDIHDWFQSMNGDYSIRYVVIGDRHIWYLKIPNNDVAILFKLTWM